MGGLPRRAAHLAKLRQTNPDTGILVLGGLNEILDKRDPAVFPPPSAAAGLVKAYEMMGYARVWLDPAEEKWLLANSGQKSLPPLFKTVPKDGLAEILEAAGLKIGFVVFPETDPDAAPDKKNLERIDALAKELLPKTNLVVGVSRLGKREEFTLLNKGDSPFDMLLGSGLGGPVAEDLAGDGKTFWVRSGVKGRSLNVIDVYDPPAERAKNQWVIRGNVRGRLDDLVESFGEPPEIKALFPDYSSTPPKP